MRAQTVSLVLLALLVGANATGVMSINKAVSLPSVNVNVSGSHSGFQFTKSIGHATPETVAAPAPVQVQAVQKPETKPAPQPERKPETKPAPQPAIQAVQKPEAKPAPQPAIQAVQKPETKPAPQPAIQAVQKPETKTAPQPEKKVEVQAEKKVEVKAEKVVEVKAEKPAFQKQIEALVATKQAEIDAHKAAPSVQEAAAPKIVSINLGHGKGVAATAPESRVQPREADSTGKGISFSIQKTLPEIDMSHGKGITLGRRLAHFGSVSINKDNAMPLVSKNISIGHSGKGIQITKSIAGAASAMEAPATPVLVEAVSKPQPKAEAKVEKKVEVQAAPVVQKSVSAQAAAPVMTKSIDMQAVHPFSKILSHLGKGVAPASEARVQPRQESTGKGFSFQKTVSLPQISFSHGKGVAATAPEARVQPREADSTGKGISFSMGNGL